MSEKAAESKSGAESPRTARDPDFDDEPEEQPPKNLTKPASPVKRVSFQDDVEERQEEAPAKPPRPMSPQEEAQATLIEAFPDLDSKVIKAVLVASGGKVEPAFNALLSMSDPNFKGEEAPPPQPPRRPQTQMESDELYARQLAEHYQSAGAYSGYGSRDRGDPPIPGQRRQTGLNPNELHDKEHSFFDDDLPEIKRQLEQGFKETQTKVNKWISDFKKKFDEPDDADFDYDEPHNRPGGAYQRQNFGPSQSQQLYGIRRSAETGRRSGERERYDADPRVLSDDFRELELRDEETPPPKPARPLANPDLFKSGGGSPQSGLVDEVEAAHQRQPTSTGGIARQPSPSGGAAGKPGGKKWQPLTSVAPNPEGEDNDPFSLGDSDEEGDKAKDIRAEDSERLKKAAEETKATPGGDSGETVKPAEKSGSAQQKDREAEELLKK